MPSKHRVRVLGEDLPLVEVGTLASGSDGVVCPSCRGARWRLRKTLIQHGNISDLWWEVVSCRKCNQRYCIYSEVPADPANALFPESEEFRVEN